MMQESGRKMTSTEALSAVLSSSPTNEPLKNLQNGTGAKAGKQKQLLPGTRVSSELSPTPMGHSTPNQVNRKVNQNCLPITSNPTTPSTILRDSSNTSATPRHRRPSSPTRRALILPSPNSSLSQKVSPISSTQDHLSHNKRVPDHPALNTSYRSPMPSASRTREQASSIPADETPRDDSDVDLFTDEVVAEQSFSCDDERSENESPYRATTSEEARCSSNRLWSDVCRDTGVNENSEDAQQKVLGHIWQKLCENQRESMSVLEELKGSGPQNNKKEKRQLTKVSPFVKNLVHRGYKFYTESENLSPWNTNEDPLGRSNQLLSTKIMEHVKGASPDASQEEMHGAIKMYWRNLRRKKNEENIWGRRQLDARRKKNKRDKCKRRLNSIHLTPLSEEERARFTSVLKTLPVDVTQSTEESGEENDPFNEGSKIKVKFVRRRKWEAKTFQEGKQLCDKVHRTKTNRSYIQRVPGAFSARTKPNVMAEFSWMIKNE